MSLESWREFERLYAVDLALAERYLQFQDGARRAALAHYLAGRVDAGRRVWQAANDFLDHYASIIGRLERYAGWDAGMQAMSEGVPFDSGILRGSQEQQGGAALRVLGVLSGDQAEAEQGRVYAYGKAHPRRVASVERSGREWWAAYSRALADLESMRGEGDA